MGYHSDTGIDQLIEDLLPDHGYAAEVGVNNGINDSITLHFEEKGWDVLCVEPNPFLTIKRKNFLRVACGEADMLRQPFHIVGKSPWASDSSRPENGGTRYSTIPDGSVTRILVNIRRLDGLLEEAGFPRLDLLVIDTEGWEAEVLQGIDLEKWQPKVIVVEEFMPRKFELTNYTPLEKRKWDAVYVRD